MSNPVQQYFASLNANPDDPEAIHGLERALSEAEAWADIPNMIPRFARELSSDQERARFLFRAAFVARDYNQDDESADALVDEVLKDEGLSPELIRDALYAAFEATGEWQELTKTTMEVIERSENNVVSARLFGMVGQVYEDRLYQRERAITCYQRAFKLDPRTVAPLHAARAIYEHAEQWGTVAKLYQLELKVTEEPAAQAQLLTELATIQLTQMGERDIAVENLRHALQIDPSAAEAREMLSRLEGDDQAHGVIVSEELMGDEAAAEAEAVAEEEEVVAEEEEEAAVEEEVAAEEEEAAAEEEEAAAEAEEEAAAEEEEAAAEAEEEAAAEEEEAAAEAEEEEVVAEEEEVAAEAEEEEVAAEAPEATVVRMEAREIDGADEALDAAIGRARSFGSDPAALSAWFWVLELGNRIGREPEELAGWLVEALSGQMDGLASVRTLVPSLIGRPDVWSAALDDLRDLASAGEVSAESLYGATFYGARDLAGAARLRGAAGETAAAEGKALAFAEKGNWRKAQGELQAPHGTDDEAELDAYVDQAYLSVAMDNVAKASDSLRRVLRKRKGDVEALRFVRVVYRIEEKWGPLAEAIRSELGASQDQDTFQKKVASRDLIQLYRDELNQPTNVLAAYKELVDVDPTDLQALDEYAALLEEMNRPQDLIPVLRMKADAVADDAARIGIHLEVAELLLERFNNQVEAITSYEAVLELDPEHQGALVALEDLYEKRRSWESLLDVKQRIGSLSGDSAVELAKLKECAEVAASRMRDNDQATAFWNQALEVAPDDADALEALERIFERDKDWVNLASTLKRRVGGIEDNNERIAALIKLGQLQSDRLDDAEASLTTYEELLSLDPENFRARDALRKAYVDLERWDDLEAFYAMQEAWPDYVRQLESLAGSHPDDATQVALWLRAADVWTDQIGDESRATKALERVLGVDPTHYQAALQLAPVYEERGDFKRLPDLLEVILEQETEPAGRFEILVKLARIARDRQRDNATAFRWFASALDESPADVAVAEELEQVAVDAGEVSSLADVLSHARSQIAGDASRQSDWIALSLRLGHVYETHLEDTDAALGAYDEVLGADPSNLEALDAKDTIFTAQESWDALLEVLAAKQAATDDDAQKVALLQRSSVIYEEQLNEPESAVLSYQEILSVEPSNLDALNALHRLHKASEDAGALEGVLQTLIALQTERGEESEVRSLRLEYAELCIEALDNPASAVATLREVVAEYPQDPFGRELLERLLRADHDRLEVARILAPLYEADEAWAKLVDVLETEVEEIEDEAAKVGLLARIGTLQRERLEDPHGALEAWARLLRIEPANREGQAAMEEIAAESQVWSPVTELYEELIYQLNSSDEDERALAVDLATRAAVFHDRELGEPEESIRMYRQVLEFEPGRMAALVELESLYERTGQWEELLAVLDERLALIDDAQTRRDLIVRGARIWEAELESPDEAIQSYRRVLDLFEEDGEALQALERLYGVTGDAASRADVLEQLVILSEGAESLDLKNRLARVCEEDLADVPRAMSLWQDVIGEDPRNEAALEGLESQLASDDYAVRASEILEPLYVGQGDPVRLAGLLETRLEYTGGESERLALFQRIATLHAEEAGDIPSAYGVLVRAAEEHLGDSALIDRLVGTAAELECLDEASDTLEALAAESADPEVVRSTLIRVAGIREHSLGDIESAGGLWRQVLSSNPVDLEALDALQRIDQETGDWEELVDVLMRKAELPEISSNPAAYKPLLFRAAGIHEQMLDQADEAVEVLRLVLSRDGADTDAIQQLERIFTQTERWEDLVEIYHRKLELASGDAERRDLYATLGAVLEHEIDDPARAIGAFQSILTIDANDLTALQSLARLYRKEEAWVELSEILSRQADLVDDPGQQRNLRFEIGQLHETELLDPTAALVFYQGILAEDSTHAVTRQALAGMVSRGEEALEAARLLEPIYREEGRWEELIAINRTLIDSAETDAARRLVYVDIARILEQELGDSAGALEAFTQAARESAVSGDLDQIERLGGSLDQWESVSELFGELWDDAVEPEVRSGLGLRVARIQESQLGDLDAAIGTYVRLHDEDPGLQVALEALHRLYARTGQSEALVDVLQQRIYAGGPSNEPTALRLQLAEVLRGDLDDPASATGVYREILSTDSRNADALQALESMAYEGQEIFDITSILEPIYREHGDWAKLVELNQARLRSDLGPDERVQVWMETAEVLENRLGDKSRALGALGNALHEVPGDVALKDRLESLAESTGDWGALARVYGGALEQELEDSDRLDIAQRLAGVLGDRLDDVSAAESAWLQVLEVEPGQVDALRALDGIYTADERWGELSSVIGRLREAVYDNDELVGLTYRQARLHQNQLADEEGAIDLYNDVLMLDGSHRPSLDALAAIYTARGDAESLFDTYERLSMLPLSDDERASNAIRMATLAAEELDRPQDAIDLWQSVLAIRPGDRQALTTLAGLYEQTELYNELGDVLDRLIEDAGSEDERVGLLRRSGRLWAETLDSPDQAIVRYERLAAIVGDEPETLLALRDLYESVGDFEKLVSTLERLLAIGAVAPEAEASIYRQLGTTYADTLGQPEPAIAAWQAVVDRVPGDGEALDRLEDLFMSAGNWRAVVGVLEQKVTATEDEGDKIERLKQIADVWGRQLGDEEQAAVAWDRVLELDLEDVDATLALEGIYERLEQWENLAGLQVDRLSVVEDPWDRLQLLRRASSLYQERLGQPDAAFVLLGTAATENPLDIDLRQELAALADETGKYDELVSTYRSIAEQLDDEPEAKVELLVAIGDLLDGRLENPTAAEEVYEQALTENPESVAAITALENIHTRSESWGSLVGVLRRRASMVSDPQEEAAIHRRIGELFETRLESPDIAIESYLQVLEIDENDAQALDALERIYEAGGSWRELIGILERKADATFEPVEQVALHSRIATIWQSRIGDQGQAIESWSRVLEYDPANANAFEKLKGLYVAGDKWEDFLDILDAELGYADSDDKRIELYANQALVQEQKFGDIDAAVGSYLNILGIAPKDLDAIESLERIYHEQDRPTDLLDVLAQHVDATEDAAEQAELFCRMGAIQVGQLDDSYAAIDSYRRAVAANGQSAEAHRRLAFLYSDSEQFQEAVGAYQRLAELTGDTQERIDSLFKAGQIQFSEMGDTEGARASFQGCLSVNPEFTPAMAALEMIYSGEGEWDLALEMLQNQVELSRDLTERSDLMVRQARAWVQGKGDKERARHLYETAIELEPSNVRAAGPLSAMFVSEGNWVRAWPLIELQLGTGGELDDADAVQLYRNAGLSAEGLGRDEDALSYYERVLNYESGDLVSLRGLARLYTRFGREDDAYQTWVDILAEHRGTMSAAEAVDSYQRAGAIKKAQGDLNEARHMFVNALELEPENGTLLREMISIADGMDDAMSAVEYKERLLPQATDPLERFHLLVGLGDSYHEAGDSNRAEEVYRQAVELDPNSKVVLHKLLNIFTGNGNWRRATEVLGQLARMEEDPARLARLHFTIATIFRDELGDTENAVEFFNQALDAQVEYLEAFEAIDHLLTEQRDWQSLERNYRKMIERVHVSGTQDAVLVQVMLLKNLGEIYRSRLQRYDAAIDAYTAASNLAPEDEVILTILAELIEHSGGSTEALIKQHQRLIAVSPFRIESYRTLFRSYVEEKRYDEAWCMSAALSLLQKATEEEDGYYNRYLPKTLREARPILNATHWKDKIYHPDLDTNITMLFELLGIHLRSRLVRDHKEWGVHKRRDRVDLTQQMPVTRTLNFAASLFGVPEVQLYQNTGNVGAVNMNVDPQAILAGGDLFQNTRPLELAFQMAKTVVLIRPEFYLASAYPSTDLLKLFFFAAVAAVTGQVMGDADPRQVTEYAQEIQTLPPQVKEQIRRAVSAIFESGRNPDLSAWLRAVDHTASRAALVFCGDLRTAVTAIKLEADRGQALSKADMKERVRELVLFNISDEHFSLRKELGLALQPK